MSAVIKATAVSADPVVRSSVEHAAIAAAECLHRVGVNHDQVDILINTGVYRDANMVEPAMAAIIQKEVGMSLDYASGPTARPGFSFDLMNGACGLLNAVQIAQASFATGTAEHVLVVSGDVHPSTKDVEGFPYATLGAAMLLARAVDRESGFGPVRTASAPGAAGVRGYLDTAVMGTSGREQITVEQDEDYVPRLVELAAGLVADCAREEDVDLAEATLVCSRPSHDFGTLLADRVGVAKAAVVTADGVAGDPHSSALTLAYQQLDHADCAPLLFLAAGAGLSAACSVYRSLK
ncbi:hypothetical protein [Amycolatopsis sp. SID8362]|uniref:hypothetical protein n=1 Tax=Amycolatopsis sp. SID8362 TaxID=2690346 RepID=UPI00136E6B7E|nr:hypothetical protein [Amycolatopsis sp. SID8362]NBH06076.1 hypothetical protein [Amycolatopsis sp. SID8362]NED42775.1 hypothetical protein [Amycolatopsis sp. SID8362]